MVAFLDADDFTRFPAAIRPLFTGRIERQMPLALGMLALADYFVVLDNRLGNESRGITVTIRAARGKQKDEMKDKPAVFNADRSRLIPRS